MAVKAPDMMICVTAQVPIWFDDQLRMAAATERISKSELLRRAAQRYLDSLAIGITGNHEPEPEVSHAANTG